MFGCQCTIALSKCNINIITEIISICWKTCRLKPNKNQIYKMKYISYTEVGVILLSYSISYWIVIRFQLLYCETNLMYFVIVKVLHGCLDACSGRAFVCILDYNSGLGPKVARPCSQVLHCWPFQGGVSVALSVIWSFCVQGHEALVCVFLLFFFFLHLRRTFELFYPACQYYTLR